MIGRFRPLPNLIMFGVAVLVAVSAGWWIAKRASELPPKGMVAPKQELHPQTKRMVHLYFGDAQGRYLVAEQRVMEQPADDVALGKMLVEALIQGPKETGTRTMPASCKVRAFYLNTAGTAFIDFEPEAFVEHPGGVNSELLSIYSIVNTLVLNMDDIRSVKFLIGGQEAATLVGHTDLREPFEVDMLWVR